jgi:hypothetical protein
MDKAADMVIVLKEALQWRKCEKLLNQNRNFRIKFPQKTLKITWNRLPKMVVYNCVTLK